MEFVMPIWEEIEDLEARKNMKLQWSTIRDESDPFRLEDQTFKKFFRFSKEVALYIIQEVEPGMTDNIISGGIPKFLKVLLALQFYGYGSYQKSIGQSINFPVSQPTASRCIKEVTKAILKCLSHEIYFPSTEQEIALIKQRFQLKYNFLGIIGIIDGTHIPIASPPTTNTNEPAVLFYCRKGYHSINVQIVCDSNLKILAINSRFPGSVHDAAVWQMSKTRTILEKRFNDGDHSSWLIGDQVYPLEPFLMTPIAQTEPNSPEARYNLAFRSARFNVEICIGHLKNVFRCLGKQRILHYAPNDASNIINVCAILHNVRVQQILD